MDRVSTAIAVLAAAIGLAFSQSAGAETQNRTQIRTGADMCSLSIPTTDTKVRPKATGFRNEGTTNAFVICTFDTPPGGYSTTNNFTYAGVVLKSMDGADHDVTCTGVNSVADAGGVGVSEPQYVAKTVTVNDEGESGPLGVGVQWEPEDFGSTGTIPDSSGLFSVTCILPPQVSIKYGGAGSEEDVGN
ncbi:hypothetical protein FNZ56_12535 [Pseudoluteimonas lycopersici]|uniref:Spore coat protein U domain-containing protein n=1 Tax=Pseudoluteimonas lycopersici TaxID=1324796 RepID=A0A516V800_9GAMM|nr:hypothetical protein [Lysobacter lycopersici]QDQ74652.1 hypothetical protein FNZ56_12535 [Lysobacter lycopersici]